MNRKILIIIVSGAILVVGGYVTYRVLSSRPLSPLETLLTVTMDLTLSLPTAVPSKKGRLIFGELKDEALVPSNKYWRLGANNATEITLSKDVMLRAAFESRQLSYVCRSQRIFMGDFIQQRARKMGIQ